MCPLLTGDARSFRMLICHIDVLKKLPLILVLEGFRLCVCEKGCGVGWVSRSLEELEEGSHDQNILYKNFFQLKKKLPFRSFAHFPAGCGFSFQLRSLCVSIHMDGNAS